MLKEIKELIKSEIIFLPFLEKPGSRSGSRGGSRQSPLRSASAVKADKERQAAKDDGRPRSWILDHVTEVVYLVTQIQLTQQIKEALAAVDDGKEDALDVSIVYFIPYIYVDKILLEAKSFPGCTCVTKIDSW